MSHTVIVTGASSGIGLEVARKLLNDGNNVVVGGRDTDRLASAVADLGAPERTLTVNGDIADPETARRLVDGATIRFGRVDALVNNAGIFGASPFEDVSAEELERFIAVNLRGTWQVTQEVVRSMLHQGTRGSIVSIGTVLTQHAVTGFQAAAPLVTKGGVEALTLALAAELADKGIRVNMVSPGVIRTPLHASDGVDGLAGLALLNRVGESHEVADAVSFLLNAEFVTGHVLNVDGGFVTGRS